MKSTDEPEEIFNELIAAGIIRKEEDKYTRTICFQSLLAMSMKLDLENEYESDVKQLESNIIFALVFIFGKTPIDKLTVMTNIMRRLCFDLYEAIK